MIIIKNLTAKNFLSIGNVTQGINFDRADLTLILGENLDLGGNGSRNGCGKSSIANALSYALYGSAIADIKANNLINHINEKNMLVSVEFAVNGTEYKIERGRKPNLLKFYRDNQDISESDAQGEMRDTQKDIDSVLGISSDMFKQAVTLNTYTEPFLSMRAGDQRQIIEQLLGITVLTEKADALREQIKISKDQIKEEEYRIASVIKANEHITEQIDSLQKRQLAWQEKNANSIIEFNTALEQLAELDVDYEISAHKQNAETKIDYNKQVVEYNQHTAATTDCNKWIVQIDNDIVALDRQSAILQKDISILLEHKCHACDQELHDEKQEKNKAAKEQQLAECATQIAEKNTLKSEYKLALAELGVLSPVPVPVYTQTFYDSIDEAHNHKNTIEMLSVQLSNISKEEDPYADQIRDMQERGIQDVSYDKINALSELQEHQAFLLKLLTNKDSFIRKKIIEQNLNYLNNRLTSYLTELGLPHNVQFMADLSVEISNHGRELDFGNLSRGERTRLILGLNFAFRDVWESLYNGINLLFIDELIDNGLDSVGVDSAVSILKRMVRERGKSIWLVSHREELISRTHNTLLVVKENGFTMLDNGVEWKCTT